MAVEKDLEIVFKGVTKNIQAMSKLNDNVVQYNELLKKTNKNTKAYDEISMKLGKLVDKYTDAVLKSDELKKSLYDLALQGKLTAKQYDELVADIDRYNGLDTSKITAKTTKVLKQQEKQLSKNQKSFHNYSDSFLDLKNDIRETGAEFAKTFIEGGNEGIAMSERIGDAWNDAADTVFAFGGVYGYAIGLAMKAMTPMIKKLFDLTQAQKEAKAAADAMKTAFEEGGSAAAEEVAQVEKLFQTLKKGKGTMAEQAEIRRQINEQYGKTLGFQLTEKSNQEDINRAYEQSKRLVIAKAVEEAKQAAFVGAVRAQIESRLAAQTEINNNRKLASDRKYYDTLIKMARTYVDVISLGTTYTLREFGGIDATIVSTSDELLANAKKIEDELKNNAFDVSGLFSEIDQMSLGLQNTLRSSVGAQREMINLGDKTYALSVANLNAKKEELRVAYQLTQETMKMAGVTNIPSFEEYFKGRMELAKSYDKESSALAKAAEAARLGKEAEEKRKKLLEEQLSLLKQINDAQKEAVFNRGKTDRESDKPFDPTDLQAYLETLYIRLERLIKLRKEGGQMTELEMQLKAEADAIQAKIDKENEYYKTQKENQEKLERQRQQAEAKRQQGSVNVQSQREQLEAIQKQGWVNPSGIAEALRQQFQNEGLGKADIDAIVPTIVAELEGSGLAKVMGDGKLRGLKLTDVPDLAEALLDQYLEIGNISVSSLYKAGYQSEASLKEYEKTLDNAVKSTEYALNKNKENLEKSKENSEILKAQAEQVEADKKAAEEARMAQTDVGRDILFIESEIAKTKEQLRQGASKGNEILDNLIDNLDLTAEQRDAYEKRNNSFKDFMNNLAVENNSAVKNAYDEITNNPEVKKNIQGLAKVLGFDANELKDIFDITDPDDEGFKRLFVTPLSDEQLADLDKEANKTYKETYMKLFEAVSKSQNVIDKEFDDKRKTAQRDFRESVLSALFGSKDLSEVVENLKSEIALRRAEMASAMPELEKEADKLKDIISTSNDPQEIEEAKTRLDNIRGSVLQTYQYIVELEQRLLKVQGADILTEAVKRGVEDLTSELQDAKTETINVTTKQEQERADIEVKFSIKNDKESSSDDDDDDDKKKKFQEIEKDISTINSISSNVFNTIGSLRDYFIDALNDSINNLTENLDNIEAEADRINSKISELEDDLEGKRSGRREAILQALEAEKQKEEELAETKMKLQEKLAKQEEKLAKQEKKRAKEQLYFDLAMAISNIAVGVTKALAAKGALGIIEGIAISAAGAVQTGLIAEQIASFAEGGFTGNGEGQRDETGFKQAGVVHEGEWVAPKWMVDSPTYGNIINSLENTRQKGFAEGGFTSPDFLNMPNLNNDNSMLRQMDMMIKSNMQMANRPIYVDVTDINNLNTTMYRRAKGTRIGG